MSLQLPMFYRTFLHLTTEVKMFSMEDLDDTEKSKQKNTPSDFPVCLCPHA